MCWHDSLSRLLLLILYADISVCRSKALLESNWFMRMNVPVQTPDILDIGDLCLMLILVSLSLLTSFPFDEFISGFFLAFRSSLDYIKYVYESFHKSEINLNILSNMRLLIFLYFRLLVSIHSCWWHLSDMSETEVRN